MPKKSHICPGIDAQFLDPILTITIKYESFMKWSGCDVMILFPPPSCFLKSSCWANGIGMFEFRQLFPPGSWRIPPHWKRRNIDLNLVQLLSSFFIFVFLFQTQSDKKKSNISQAPNVFHGCNLPSTHFFQGQRQAVLGSFFITQSPPARSSPFFRCPRRIGHGIADKGH